MTISLKRLLAVTSLLVMCVASSIQAQDSDPDPEGAPTDNPTARLEFERSRRADPATGQIPSGMRSKELRFAASLQQSVLYAAKGASSRPPALSVNWQERGPGNQGGRTRGLAIDVSDESVLFAGSPSGGLWRSADTGRSWTRVTPIDQIQSVTTIAQDTRVGSQQVWYYGTGETRANSANLPGDGIFKSTDRGLSWSRLASTVKNTPQSRDQMFDYVHRIVVDASNPNEDEVYAACYGGIARSTDGGKSWEEVLGGFSNRATYTDVAITSTGVLYATLSKDGRNEEGIYRSVNGVDWVNITPADFPQNYARIVLAIAPSNEDIVYFFGRTNGTPQNGHSLWVYDHNDGNGALWENRSDGMLFNTETYNNYCQAIAVKPDNEDVVYLGQVRIQRTTDGFRDSNNIRNQNAGGQHADQHAYAFFPSDPDKMIAGHDGGVSICYDNSAELMRWEFRNRGYGTSQFYSIAVDPTTPGNPVVIGGTQDNGSWRLNGEEGLEDGRRVFGADGGYAAIADGGVDHYTSYQNGVIFRSQYNESGVRTRWARVDPVGGDSYMFIHPYTLDRADTKIMYLPEGRTLWKNSDLTEIALDNRNQKKTLNWEKLRDPILPTGQGNISAVATSLRNPAHVLYFGTTSGFVYRLNNPGEEGSELTEITSEEMPTGRVNCIVVDPDDGNRLMLTFSNYNVQSIFLSEDGGASWEPVSGNLEEQENGRGNGPSVSWLAMYPIDNARIYLAGTTTGLYSTTLLDGMNTVWQQEGASTLGNVVVDMIAVRDSDGYVAVGTHGRGIFTGNLSNALTRATLTLSDGSVGFPDTEVGSTSLDTFAVLNRGDSEREITGSVRLEEGPFELVFGGGTFRTDAGQEHQVIVRFVPDAVGLLSGRVSVQHDATSPAGEQTVWLVGKGLPNPLSVHTDSEGSLSLRVVPAVITEAGVVELSALDGGMYRADVVDATGRELSEVHHGYLEPGEHTLPISVDALPSGRYQLSSYKGWSTLPDCSVSDSKVEEILNSYFFVARNVAALFTPDSFFVRRPDPFGRRRTMNPASVSISSMSEIE